MMTDILLLISFLIIAPAAYFFCSIKFEERGVEPDILDKFGFACTGFCTWLGVALFCAFLKAMWWAVWTAATL